jgi:hypothetical protein
VASLTFETWMKIMGASRADPLLNYAVAMTDEVLKQILAWAPTTFQYKDGRLSVKNKK